MQKWPLAAAWAWTSPLALVAARATQISMAPAAAWPSDTNMAPGEWPRLLALAWP